MSSDLKVGVRIFGDGRFGMQVQYIMRACIHFVMHLIKVPTEKKTHASIYLGYVIYNSSSWIQDLLIKETSDFFFYIFKYEFT